ncbi:MAG TPA: peptidoglycan DD-metalloendopeptidase family protein [Symbiobacteriaceae bacterium]|nr:peptidoglycan DD-metalloendopeptidase family protein [Symbiobacteriaceae bacterium]
MHSKRGSSRIRRYLATAALLSAVVALGVPQASADPADEIKQLQQQMNEIGRKKNQASNELERANLDAEEAATRLDLVEQEYAVAKGQADVINSQVVTTTNELKKVEAELKEAEKQYQQRKTAFASRVRAIQEEGRVNYVGVLLGSSSFGDFISRFDMLKLVVQQDSKLFGKIRDEKKQLEDKRQDVANRQTQLLALQARAKEREQQVASKRAEHEQVSRSLNTRVSSLKAQLDAYDAEAAEVADQVWRLQQKMNRPSGGAFSPIFPVRNYTITDVFGPRMHPILGVWRNHNGTDFAANSGTPVYAIESGTVIVAGWNDAYGNLVVIDHGNGIASWYGHSSKLLVSEGQAVTKGQQISNAGSTGWSTGPHVHLEIHVNGKPVDPMTYLQ